MIDPLYLRDWPADLGQIADDMNDKPLNIHGVMAHHPKLLNAWWPLRQHAVSGGSLGPRAAELVILRVAVHLRSWYEWASHVDRARRVGLEASEIARVMSGPDADGWSVQDTILLQAVDEAMQARKITPETLMLLKRHYDDQQCLDLIAICGMYMTLGIMLNSFDTDLDADVDDSGTQSKEDWLAALPLL